MAGGSNGGSGGFSAPRSEREKSRSSAGRATTSTAAAANAAASTPEPSPRPHEGVEPGLVRAYAPPVSMYAKLNGKWKQKPIFLRRNLSYCRQARRVAREYKQTADVSSDAPKVDISVTVALARCTDEQAQSNVPLNARTYSSLSEEPQEMSVLVAVVDPSPTATPVSRARCLSVPFTCGEASTSGRTESKELPCAFFPWVGTFQDKVASTFELLFIVWEAHPDLRCLRRPQGAPISAETMALGSIPVNSTVSYASVPLRSVLPPKAVSKHTVVMRLIQLSRGVLRKRSIRGVAQLYVEPLPQGQSAVFLKVHADISSPSSVLSGDVSSKTQVLDSGELLFTYMFDGGRKRIEIVYHYQCPFCCLKCGSVIGLSLHVLASHDMLQYSAPFDARSSRTPQITVQPRPELYDAEGQFIGEKPLDFEWTIVAKSFYFMSRPKTWAGWLRLLTELWGNCNMSLLSSGGSASAAGGKASSRPADVSEVTELASHPSSSNSAPVQPNNMDERDVMITEAEAAGLTAGKLTPLPKAEAQPQVPPPREASVEEKGDKVSSKLMKSKSKVKSISTEPSKSISKLKATKSKSKSRDVSKSKDVSKSLNMPKSMGLSMSKDASKSINMAKSMEVSKLKGVSKSVDVSKPMDVSISVDMSKSMDVSNAKDRSKAPLTTSAVTSKKLIIKPLTAPVDDQAAVSQPSSTQPTVKQMQAEDIRVEAKVEKRPAKQPTLLSAQAKEALSARRFYHSRTAQLMTLEEVLSDQDSDDELDEEQAEADDRRMLESFKNLAVHEKDFMSMWNTFRRKHPVYGDRDMPKVCELFAQEHTTKFAEQPELRSVFVQLLIHLWDIAVLESVHVDGCLRLADGDNTSR